MKNFFFFCVQFIALAAVGQSNIPLMVDRNGKVTAPTGFWPAAPIISQLNGVGTNATIYPLASSADNVALTAFGRVVAQDYSGDAGSLTISVPGDVYSAQSAWRHPRGDAELLGDSTYTAGVGVFGVGFYELLSATTTFDSIRCSVACNNLVRDVAMRIIARDDTAAFSPNTAAVLYSNTIPAAQFPHSMGVATFNLPASFTVPGGKYLFVLFDSAGDHEMQVAYWHADWGTAPGRHAFVFDNGMTQFSSTFGGYWGATFQLLQNQNLAKSTTLAWEHPRGDAELSGNDSYSHATFGKVLGFYEKMAADTSFDSVVCHAWCNNLGRDISMCLYERDTADTFAPSGVTPLCAVTLPALGLPHGGNSLLTVNLGQCVTAHANKCLFVLLADEAQTTAELNIGRWNVDASNPSRHGFVYGSSLNSLVNLASGAGNFQSSFRLLRHVPVPAPLGGVFSNFPAALATFDNAGTGISSRNVQAAIVETYCRAASSGVPPRIVLPDEIVAVTGDKLQLFLRGVVEAANPYAFATEMQCPVGASYPRYYEYLPAANQTGAQTLSVSVFDHTGKVLASNSTVIRTVAPVRAPAVNKNVLCVGDSLTEGGQWPQEFYRRLTQSGGSPVGLSYGNISFIGNQAIPGFPAQKFIGYGGWSWDNYLGLTPNTAAWVSCSHDKDATDQKACYKDSANNKWLIETIQSTKIKMIPYAGATSYSMPGPSGTLTWVSGGTHTSAITYSAVTSDASTPFWNGSAFSFSGFCAGNGYSGIDVVYVLLGWNGLAEPNAANAVDHAAAIAKARTFLNQFHADYPAGVVRLVGIQVPSVNGGLGANYGAAGAMANYYKLLRSVNGLRLAYQSLANESAYSSYVKFIDIAPQFDSEFNMQQADVPVNGRNAITEKRGTNGVHPDTAGYLQIADAVWRDFVRTFCQ